MKTNKQFYIEDRNILLWYWQQYHMREIMIEKITLPKVLSLPIMQQRFISNRCNDTYDFFIPNNLK